MNEKTVSRRHIIALVILYVLGNGIIIFPLNGTDEFGFTAYLVSLLLLIGFYSLFNVITSKISKTHKAVFCGYILLISVVSLFIGASAFKDIVRFMSQTLLQGVPTFFISLIFLQSHSEQTKVVAETSTDKAANALFDLLNQTFQALSQSLLKAFYPRL